MILRRHADRLRRAIGCTPLRGQRCREICRIERGDIDARIRDLPTRRAEPGRKLTVRRHIEGIKLGDSSPELARSPQVASAVRELGSRLEQVCLAAMTLRLRQVFFRGVETSDASAGFRSKQQEITVIGAQRKGAIDHGHRVGVEIEFVERKIERLCGRRRLGAVSLKASTQERQCAIGLTKVSAR